MISTLFTKPNNTIIDSLHYSVLSTILFTIHSNALFSH